MAVGYCPGQVFMRVLCKLLSIITLKKSLKISKQDKTKTQQPSRCSEKGYKELENKALWRKVTGMLACSSDAKPLGKYPQEETMRLWVYISQSPSGNQMSCSQVFPAVSWIKGLFTEIWAGLRELTRDGDPSGYWQHWEASGEEGGGNYDKEDQREHGNLRRGYWTVAAIF